MKIMVAVLMAAALMACGGKSKKTATPDNADTAQTTTPADGTGGTTYGGAPAPEAAPASTEATPAAGAQ